MDLGPPASPEVMAVLQLPPPEKSKFPIDSYLTS